MIHALLSFFPSNTLQLGEKFELIANLHLLVQSALFRKVADPVLQFRSNLLAEERNPARIGRRDINYHPDSRRFPSTVRANQSEDSPGVNRQAQVVNSGKLTEAFRDVVEYDGGGVIPHRFLWPEAYTENNARLITVAPLVRKMARQCLCMAFQTGPNA
jgi:hypothetical protein